MNDNLSPLHSSNAALLALLRLGSAALPIGAFAYSQGLEQAVADRLVTNSKTTLDWCSGVIENSLATLDLPVVLRLADAWDAGDRLAVEHWNDFLFASRGSNELRAEEALLGRALARLLQELGIEAAAEFRRKPNATLASLYALAGSSWKIAPEGTALAYGFAWAEAQVGAATRLIPLGQSDAQRVLSGCVAKLDQGLIRAIEIEDCDLASTTPGQLLLSMRHETLYSRLFRS